MKQVIISAPAKEDLYSIAEYIAQRSPEAAVRLLKQFRQKFELLASFPLLGRERNDIAIGIRCFVMGKYLIFYQPHDDTLEIWRIRHSAQDLADLLADLP